MLETIRKHHYILMLLVAIVVCVAFVFFGDYGSTPGGQNSDSKPLFTIGDQELFRNDLAQIDSQRGIVYRLLDPKNQLAQFTDPLAFYVNTLGGNPMMGRPAIVQRYGMTSRDNLNMDFCLNVATLRAEAKKLGVAVNREDLAKFVTTIGGFQTNGQFDPALYEAFLNSGALGDRTNTERRLYTTLHDVMVFQRMNKLIGGTYAPSTAEVTARYHESKQKTTAAYAVVARDKQTPADLAPDAVKNFYETESVKFSAADSAKGPVDPLILSDEKRTIHYVVINLPEMPPALTSPQPEDTSGLNEEQKKAKEEEYSKKVADHTAAIAARAEQMKTMEQERKELLQKASNVSSELASDERGDRSFEDIAKAAGLEPKLSEAFSASNAPEDLKADPALVQAIFGVPGDPGVSHTEKTAKGYAVFEIVKVDPPAVRPLAEVEAAITEKLKADAVTTALATAAESARSSIGEAVKSGKTFAEAAAAAGLETTELPAFTREKPPVSPYQAVITAAAAELNPGEISPPKEIPEGLILVTTLKRELPQDPKMAEEKENMTREMTEGGEGGFLPTYSPLFEAWFSSRRNESSEVDPEAL